MPIVLKSSTEALLKYALPVKEDSGLDSLKSMEDARLHIYLCAKLLMSSKLRTEFSYWSFIRSELNAVYAPQRGAVLRVCRYFSHHLVCLHCGRCRRIKSSQMFTATCIGCAHFPTEQEFRYASMLSSEVNTMFWAVDRPYMDEFLDHYLTES
jgi:hypothetical protein